MRKIKPALILSTLTALGLTCLLAGKATAEDPWVVYQGKKGHASAEPSRPPLGGFHEYFGLRPRNQHTLVHPQGKGHEFLPVKHVGHRHAARSRPGKLRGSIHLPGRKQHIPGPMSGRTRDLIEYQRRFERRRFHLGPRERGRQLREKLTSPNLPRSRLNHRRPWQNAAFLRRDPPTAS